MSAFRLKVNAPLFRFESRGRAGPKRQHLKAAQIEQISRTIGRTPEVMVKVTGGTGSAASRGVSAHINYITREGKLGIETDDERTLIGKGAGQQLIDNWDLDLDQDRHRAGLFAFHRRKAPKLVRKITFSMPAGTPATKLLAAVRDFTRDKFLLKHRYAMVLHTDTPHPHVHVTVKAISENGVRLDIGKATLRHWREEFARHLREHGVEANATERRIRGQSRSPKSDPIFRAAQRGESLHMVARSQQVMREQKASSPDDPSAARLQRTRADTVREWQSVRDLLVAEGHQRLADQVARFVSQMPPPRTDKQWLAEDMLNAANKKVISRSAPESPFARDPSRDRSR